MRPTTIRKHRGVLRAETTETFVFARRTVGGRSNLNATADYDTARAALTRTLPAYVSYELGAIEQSQLATIRALVRAALED